MAARNLPMEVLRLGPMASGHLALELTERIGWTQSADYAAELLARLGAKVIDTVDPAEMRIWNLAIEGVTVRLVYEDFPQMISLEANAAAGDELLTRLASRFAAEPR